MRKIKLYIAISLDGRIAKPDGDVEWLHAVPNPEGSDYGYAEFIAGVDTTLMGYKTYQEIMGFDMPFPYADKTNYVFTRQQGLKDNEHVRFVASEPIRFLQELRNQPGKDIWLIGGGQLNSLLLNHGLIDEMMVFIMPVVIGEGIPLFAEPVEEKPLRLNSRSHFSSGVTLLNFTPVNQPTP